MARPARSKGQDAATVVVQAEARALFRALRGGASEAPAPLPPAGSAPVPVPASGAPDPAAGSAADGPQDAGRDAPHARFLLRRDGLRPLAVRGAELTAWALDDPGSGARFALALYLTEDGDVVAALSATPPPDSGARPVHTAERVAAPDALAALLARFDPAAGAPLDLGLSEPLSRQSQSLSRSIREGFHRFAEMLRAGRRASLLR